MKSQCIYFLLMSIGIAWPAIASLSESGIEEPCFFRLDAFGRIPVLEGGRKMPLDTYARNKLLQFSGRSRLLIETDHKKIKMPAIGWLARVVLAPSKTFNDKLFLVDHPEVIQALGLDAHNRARYSYAQIRPTLHILDSLARKAFGIEEDQRSIVEKGLIQLYVNVQQYVELMHSLRFTRPDHDFLIRSHEAKAGLDLPLEKNIFGCLDIHRRREKLEKIVESFAGKEPPTWTTEEADYARVLQNYSQQVHKFRKIKLFLVPGQDHGDDQWETPWELLASQGSSTTDWDFMNAFEQMAFSYEASDQMGFDEACRNIRSLSIALNPNDRELKSSELEIFLNQIQPFMWAKVGYFFSFLCAFAAFLIEGRCRKVAILAGTIFVLITLIPHTCGMVSRILITGRPPVTNLYTTFIFVGWVCVILSCIVEMMQRNGLGVLMAGFSGCVLLLISGRFALDGDTLHKVVAVLDSNFWLSTHVICITTGYAGCFLAGIVGHVYLILAIVAPQRQSQLDAVSRILYGILGFGVTFSFLGTMLGGVWADQSWGRFWGWDPKENGALLIVLWCAILFHARLAGIINMIGMAAGSALGIIVVMLAWLGVNLLSVGLHSYGFTSDLAIALESYIIIQLLVVAILSPTAYLRSSP